MRVLTRLTVATTFVLMAIVVVFVWHIGPVAIRITPGHGIHEGDVLALPLLLGAVALVDSVRIRPARLAYARG